MEIQIMSKSWDFPVGSVVKNPSAKKEMLFDPRVQKIPWHRKWQPTQVFLPGKSHGQRSLVGSGGLKELNTIGHHH